MPIETITIPRVDPVELEAQRKMLGTISPSSLSHEQADALEGVLNMLDYWSDARKEDKQ